MLRGAFLATGSDFISSVVISSSNRHSTSNSHFAMCPVTFGPSPSLGPLACRLASAFTNVHCRDNQAVDSFAGRRRAITRRPLRGCGHGVAREAVVQTDPWEWIVFAEHRLHTFIGMRLS